MNDDLVYLTDEQLEQLVDFNWHTLYVYDIGYMHWCPYCDELIAEKDLVDGMDVNSMGIASYKWYCPKCKSKVMEQDCGA